METTPLTDPLPTSDDPPPAPDNPPQQYLSSPGAYSVQNAPTEEEEQAIEQELKQLHSLCNSAKENDQWTWDHIRDWVEGHSHTDQTKAAEMVGEFSTISLHLACRNRPPGDIVRMLLDISPDTVQWSDAFGWLPLHYACANGASKEVIEILLEELPESTTAIDKRGRTPLHFALGNNKRPASHEVVQLLCENGTAECADEGCMLPIHYACAYGSTPESVAILLEMFPESIDVMDKKGRSPVHFALGNADRESSPEIVKQLLLLNPKMSNNTEKDGSELPLTLLSTRAATITPEKTRPRENAAKCMDLYLNSKPIPTTDFMMALQALPDWLRDIAVVTPAVQDILNQKISLRFPTAILIMDFYVLASTIICFYLAIQCSMDQRFGSEEEGVPIYIIIILYVSAGYFILKEWFQIMSLVSLGLLKTWFTDPYNWLDAVHVFIVLYWTIIMQFGGGGNDFFRNGAALSIGVMWVSVLSYLKSTLIDFAVFVDGLFYVVQRLTTFLISLSVILVAFATMFVVLFQSSDQCKLEAREESGFPFCDWTTSFITVYTMLLGEVDDSLFLTSTIAIIFFSIFMFLVVILLANILIAIVTDSYGFVKNERAAIVFWSNRMDFVAEMDAISNGPWIKKIKACNPFCRSSAVSANDSQDHHEQHDDFGREVWSKLIGLFDDEELSVFSWDFWAYALLRFFTFIFIVFMWLPIGLVTAGCLWPPQVREFLTIQRTKNLDSQGEELSYEVKVLRQEVKDLQKRVMADLSIERAEMTQVKMLLRAMNEEMKKEVNDVNELTNILQSLFATVDQ